MALRATHQYQWVWGFLDFSATTVVAAQCCSPRCGGAAATGKRDGRRETRLSDTEGMLASPCTFPQSFSVIPVKREESEGQSVGKQERGRWGGNFSSYIYKGAKRSTNRALFVERLVLPLPASISPSSRKGRTDTDRQHQDGPGGPGMRER